MANKSVNGVTSVATFSEIPVHSDWLLEVRGGVPVEYAERLAYSLEVCVQKLMSAAIAEDGMDGYTVVLCDFALEAAGACRRAASHNR